MKANDIRKLKNEQIEKKIADLTKELFNLKFQLATGNLENTARIKNIKKTIARMKTVLSETTR